MNFQQVRGRPRGEEEEEEERRWIALKGEESRTSPAWQVPQHEWSQCCRHNSTSISPRHNSTSISPCLQGGLLAGLRTAGSWRVEAFGGEITGAPPSHIVEIRKPGWVVLMRANRTGGGGKQEGRTGGTEGKSNGKGVKV